MYMQNKYHSSNSHSFCLAGQLFVLTPDSQKYMYRPSLIGCSKSFSQAECCTWCPLTVSKHWMHKHRHEYDQSWSFKPGSMPTYSNKSPAIAEMAAQCCTT